MVITISPEREAALNDVARWQGIAPEVLVHNDLRERFLPPAPLIEPRDEWERRLRSLANDCGVSLPDSAVSTEGLYK